MWIKQLTGQNINNQKVWDHKEDVGWQAPSHTAGSVLAERPAVFLTLL